MKNWQANLSTCWPFLERMEYFLLDLQGEAVKAEVPHPIVKPLVILFEELSFNPKLPNGLLKWSLKSTSVYSAL